MATSPLYIYKDAEGNILCKFSETCPTTTTKHGTMAILQVDLYVTGDLAFQAMALGKESMSGHWCMQCTMQMQCTLTEAQYMIPLEERVRASIPILKNIITETAAARDIWDASNEGKLCKTLKRKVLEAAKASAQQDSTHAMDKRIKFKELEDHRNREFVLKLEKAWGEFERQGHTKGNGQCQLYFQFVCNYF